MGIIWAYILVVFKKPDLNKHLQSESAEGSGKEKAALLIQTETLTNFLPLRSIKSWHG